MSNKIKINDAEIFLKVFDEVQPLYRTGKTEDQYFIPVGKEWECVEKNNKAIPLNAVPLIDVAHELFIYGKEFWENDNLSFSRQHFQKVLRAMTISFELDEKYLVLNNLNRSGKKDFFIKFNNDFFSNNKSDSINWISYIKEIGYRKKIFGRNPNPQSIIQLANELILFSLCGLNAIVLTHNSEYYEVGLKQAEKIEDCITTTSALKTILRDKTINAAFQNLPIYSDNTEIYGLGLKALCYFFKGRLYFGTNQLKDAENSFKKSKNLYFNKVNSLLLESGEKQRQRRSLALRRANAVELIGLVNLYYSQSKIKEADEILKRTIPLLSDSFGKMMEAYCKLLIIRVERAKHSNEIEKLNKLDEIATECLKVFSVYVPRSHFIEYIRVEKCLIKFYIAIHEDTSEEERRTLFKNCFSLLRKAEKYAKGNSEGNPQDNPPKNRRILIETCILRSHIYKNLAETEPRNFNHYIRIAQRYARKALNYAQNLPSYEAECFNALGSVFLSKFEYRVKEETNQWRKKNYNWKKIAEKYDEIYKLYTQAKLNFHKALEISKDQNVKNESISLLKLTDAELKMGTNKYQAQLLYDEFKQVKNKVGHEFIKTYANTIGAKLEEAEEWNKLKFSVDIIRGNENLNYNYWSDNLRKFLIQQTIYHTALERKGLVPPKRRRRKFEGEKINIMKSTFTSGKHIQPDKDNPKETQNSVLANALRKKMGLGHTDANNTAEIYLDEFLIMSKLIYDKLEKNPEYY